MSSLRGPSSLQRSRMGGFTLVELLVTMALLSLLMLGMASALRTMAQTEERVDARLADADEFRIATGFLRTVLGRISAQKNTALSRAGSSSFLFEGLPDAVSWIGVMPARYGAGGRNFFRLAVEPVQGEAALVVRFVPWVDSAAFPDWAQAQSRVLVQGVTAFSLVYEDAHHSPSMWVSTWGRTDSVPERVRLELQTRAGPWPVWVVAMRRLPASARGSGRFSAGPE